MQKIDCAAVRGGNGKSKAQANIDGNPLQNKSAKKLEVASLA